MNSPWDPRYEKAFYLAIDGVTNYKFFKEVDEAQQFIEHSTTDGKCVVFHVLPIITMMKTASSPKEIREDDQPEVPEIEPEPEVIPPEFVAETPNE